MGTRLTSRRGSRLTIVASLTFLIVGLLGGQVTATWDLPDDSYAGGFWDGGDEDALLALVWDHSSGTLPDIALLVALWATQSADAPSANSADSNLLSSYDSRAPPLV